MTDAKGQPVAPPALDRVIEGKLRRIIRRMRSYVLVEGVALVAGFLFLAAHLQLALDYFRRLDWSMRAALSAAILACGCVLTWRRIITPLRVRLTLSDAAHLVERKNPRLASVLISAVRFSSGRVGPAECNSPVMVASVVGRAARACVDVDFPAVLDGRRARNGGLLLAGLIAFTVFAGIASPDLMGIWFARNVLLRNVDWPQRTRLIVELDADVVRARGDDIEIRAHAQGVVPGQVDIIYENESGRRGRETMVLVGENGFRHTFRNVDEGFHFRLEGGDDRTNEFWIRLTDRPRVVRATVTIEPPAYTGMSPIVLGEGRRAARVLRGSTVSFAFTTNKPVVRADLMAGHDLVAEATPIDADGDDEYRVAPLTPTKTRTYHVLLRDEAGLENRNPARWALRVVSDEAPTARLFLSGVGEMITPEAVLPIEVEFADAYGLASAELAYEVTREGGGSGLIALPGFTPGARTLATSLSWPVSEAGMSPGERISLHARATDFDDVSGPNYGQSQEQTLRVVSREELLSELARREQAARRQFERLIDEQEQIRGALLTVIGRYLPDDRNGLSAGLAPLERRQRNVAGSVNVVRQQFQQVLTELRINALDTSALEQRLGDDIIDPLTMLARRDLVAEADALRSLAEEGTVTRAAKIDPEQERIIDEMRRILSRMLEWEGYQEVVNMLRDIIRLQEELQEETRAQLGDQVKDVFDD